MHFKDKQRFLSKVASLLKINGLFCLSMDQNQSSVIDIGNRMLEIYPDHPKEITACIEQAGLKIIRYFDTEAAHVLICKPITP